MKKFKKLAALILSVVMVMSMAVSASADTNTSGTQTVTYSRDDSTTNAKITITNASKGVTYSVYKLFDAKITGVDDGSIVYTGTIPDSLSTYFEINSSGNIIAKDAATNNGEMSADLQAALTTWALDQTATLSETGDGSSTLVFENLPYGYYVVATALGDTAITVTSTNPSVTLNDKNAEKPLQNGNEPYKKITNATDNTNVQVGDTVGFSIQFATVNYAGTTAVESYTIVDTPTNLKIDKSSVVVKVGDTQLTQSTDYTLSFDNGKMTINIPWATKNDDGTYTSKYDNGAAVVITYTAEVTSIAALTTGTATNSVAITYNEGVKVNEPTNDNSKTTLTTTSLTIKKVDQNNVALTGAVFELYVSGSDTPINLFGNDGVYYVADSDTIASADDDDLTIITQFEVSDVTDNKGEAVIKGLDLDQTYVLKEVTAPDGYNIYADDITIEASNSADDVVIKNNDVTLGTGKFAAATNGTNAANAFQTQVIVNATGSTLPSTGGMGTTVFYVVGGVMVVAALALLITRKRTHMDD